MDSWDAPRLPSLPGRGEQPRVFDTAAGKLMPVGPKNGEQGTARMYVCGITPYDAAHLGHAATYISFDLLNRVWRDAGHTVHYVQNVTDIDDPLLERANRDGERWDDLARRETQLFREDMTAVRVLPPDAYIGVVESMPGIVEMVEKLLAGGEAYQLDDGTNDIYFDLSTAENFGYESHLDKPAMVALFAERGGDPDRAHKRRQLDPLVWRGARPGEPSWEAPFGAGRPGWHIECSVIAVAALGMRIDVQGGASDLIFPHHEMSAAHAEVAFSGHPFAKAYVHAGLIALDGEKMSKSKGNLVFTSALREQGIDPAAIRLALLAGHYRQDRPWTPALLDDAHQRLARWRAATNLATAPDALWVLTTVRQQLADDLNTPAALAAIDEWAGAALADNSGQRNPHAPLLVADVADALLGIRLRH